MNKVTLLPWHFDPYMPFLQCDCAKKALVDAKFYLSVLYLYAFPVFLLISFLTFIRFYMIFT